MPRLYRVDYGTIGKVEKTPQGGLKIPAFLTRTGVFEYAGEHGETIKEYRPPEEVFNADSMAMLRGAPIALDHPPEPIKPDNYRTYTIGHVSDDVRQDDNKVGATLFVQDLQAIKAVEAGRRELSCGYHCDVDETPGITPQGESYDRIQRHIQYNHLALVDNGRAGHDVRLRLDSAGNAVTKGEFMEKVEIIDGVDYVAGSDAHRAAKERRDSQERKRAKTFDQLVAERDQAVARADAANERRKNVLQRVKTMITPERLDRAVRRRTVVIGKATAVLGPTFKADGLTNIQIKAAVVAKHYPKLRLDGKSQDYVNGLFHSIQAKPQKPRLDGVDRMRAAVAGIVPAHLATPPGGVQGKRSLDQARNDAMMESEERSHRPLALSRRDRFKQLSSHPMLQGAQLEVEK